MFKKSWKTTVAGIVLGSIPLQQGIANSLVAGSPIDWKNVAFGFGIMVFGALMKDFDVSHPQPQ